MLIAIGNVLILKAIFLLSLALMSMSNPDRLRTTNAQPSFSALRWRMRIRSAWAISNGILSFFTRLLYSSNIILHIYIYTKNEKNTWTYEIKKSARTGGARGVIIRMA